MLSRLVFVVGLVLATLVSGLSIAEENYAPASGNRVAVVIGNQDYQHGIADVSWARNDAAAVSQMLVDVMGFHPDDIIRVEDATLARMNALFGDEKGGRGQLQDWLRDEKAEVVVYFSGHGAPGLENRQRYLLPVDADANRAELTGYPLERLYRNLSALPARSVTVLLDACFSGESNAGTLLTNASPVARGGLAPMAGTVSDRLAILSASRDDQIASWDGDARHGFFTEYLLRATYGEARSAPYGDGSGALTLKAVADFLDDQMTYAVRRQYGRLQNPVLAGDADRILAPAVRGDLPERPKVVDGRALAADSAQATAEPQKPDVVKMRNGDRFEGQVQLDAVRVLTPYGLVSVPRSVIQSVTLTGERKNVETVLTIHGGRFSGQFIDELFPVVTGGNEIPLRKEAIGSISFGSVASAPPPGATVQFTMRNTDAFNGVLLTEIFRIITSYGELEFPAARIARINLEGDATVVAKVELKDGAGTFQGNIGNEAVDIQTAFGESLSIYRDKFAEIRLDTPTPHPTAGAPARTGFCSRPYWRRTA